MSQTFLEQILASSPRWVFRIPQPSAGFPEVSEPSPALKGQVLSKWRKSLEINKPE
jgi:hypothetical protein